MLSHSKKIDEMLTELKMDGLKHVSLKHATTEERLVAMHCNEMKNVKARRETLFIVRKWQLIKTKDETTSVEQLIRNIKVNGVNLFLVVEQDSGQFVNDVQVVMNPVRKIEATSWIVHEHALLSFCEAFECKMSIKKGEIHATNVTKSQEELRAFLRLVLQRPEAKKRKMFKTKRKHT